MSEENKTETLKSCPTCGINNWYKDRQMRVYECLGCATKIEISRITNRPIEDALRSELDLYKALEKQFREEAAEKHLEIKALRAEIEECKELISSMSSQLVKAAKKMDEKDAEIARLRESQIPGMCKECAWGQHGDCHIKTVIGRRLKTKSPPYCSAFAPRKDGE